MNLRRFVLINALTLLSTGIGGGTVASAQQPAVDLETAAQRVRLFDSFDQPAGTIAPPAVPSATIPAAPATPHLGGPATVYSPYDRTDRVQPSQPTAAELRQARALYRANQRTARLEYNLWMGHEPLRPNWSATPTMTSRYGNRTIYVPVFVYPSR